MIFHTIFYKPCKEGGAHNNMHKNTQKSLSNHRFCCYLGPRDAERWPSGRRRTPGKCVYGNPVSRVRIPFSPPYLKFSTSIDTTLSSYGHLSHFDQGEIISYSKIDLSPPRR